MAKLKKESKFKPEPKIKTKRHLKSEPRMMPKPKRILSWTTWSPSPVMGVDEVGRGCLAGPVYAAAVVLNSQFRYSHFTDSKVLSAERREELSAEILSKHWAGIGFATCEEVDAINILQASFLAMCRAVEKLTTVLEAVHQTQLLSAHVVVDGHMRIAGLPSHFVQTPIVKGDLRVAPVSAASIVAKVARDQFMIQLAEQFPQYGFQAHKGYGTKEHQAALKQWGPCSYHRRSFSGVLETPENFASE